MTQFILPYAASFILLWTSIAIGLSVWERRQRALVKSR